MPDVKQEQMLNYWNNLFSKKIPRHILKLITIRWPKHAMKCKMHSNGNDISLLCFTLIWKKKLESLSFKMKYADFTSQSLRCIDIANWRMIIASVILMIGAVWYASKSVHFGRKSIWKRFIVILFVITM